MHNYLRAIGFNDYFKSEYEIDLFLDELFHTYQQKKAVHDENAKDTFLELSRSFGPNMGIRVCGEMDDNGFHRRYYYPYLAGTGDTTDADLTMEKKVNGECWAGMCEDARLGKLCQLLSPRSHFEVLFGSAFSRPLADVVAKPYV